MKVRNRWVILIASCLINLCIGSVYAWSVFSGPMAAYLSELTNTLIAQEDLAIVFTVTNLMGPVMMIGGGKINDTIGPKMLLLLGGIVFGAGVALSGFVNSVGLLILCFGVVGGLGFGAVYGCAISNSVKFFPDKRGLAGGLTTAFYGLGSVVLPPIANVMIDNLGITSTFKVLGLFFGVVIVVASLFVEKCPEGYMPKGYVPKEVAKSTVVDKNWKEMLKSPIFYVMFLMLVSCGFCGLMCTSQASSIGQNMIGMTAASAAIAVSVLALFNAGGRIVAGHISDRIGRISTLTLACICEIVGLLCLFACTKGNVVLFYIGISLVGIAFGAFMGVFPGFTADQFGAKNNSVNYGIVFIGFAISGYFGPQAMSAIYKAQQDYKAAFLIAAVIAVVGFALTYLYRVMVKKMK